MPSITKPCHNCRRRRLRCDRSWPTCHKCAGSGQECLGYGRVFVWTQNFDAHGLVKSQAQAAAAVSVSLSNWGPSLDSAAAALLGPSSSSRRKQLKMGHNCPGAMSLPADGGGASGGGASGGEHLDLEQGSGNYDQSERAGRSERSGKERQQQPQQQQQVQQVQQVQVAGIQPGGSIQACGIQPGSRRQQSEHETAPPSPLHGAHHHGCSDSHRQNHHQHPHSHHDHTHLPHARLPYTPLSFARLPNVGLAQSDHSVNGSAQSDYVLANCSLPHPAIPTMASNHAYSSRNAKSMSWSQLSPSRSGSVSLQNLTDPLFQDLDRTSRYYLAHFADRVCKDLVARDSPGCNPFRELIPLTYRHPLLLHILIATSALHWSNIFRPMTSIRAGLTDTGSYLAQLREKDIMSRQALVDALEAKQKAIGHLRQVLDVLDPAGSEVALAAMHFFVKFDLIDLDRGDDGDWQTHLEGASSILALLSPGGTSATSSSRMLRDCVLADCFIYHILGSTLASASLAARIARYAFELLPVMKRVEVNSYLSCPAEILQVILVASQLSYQTPLTDWSLSAASDALGLISQALAFDIPAWASQLLRRPDVTDIESRMHVASAHRSAACLYILQALPLVRAAQPVDADLLVSDILGHLAQISSEDPYFKATSWPTFIAGAETRDAEKRAWTLGRLFAIWETCSWGYIFTAIEMLKATWAMQDRHGNPDAAINWLQELKAMGFDPLIV